MIKVLLLMLSFVFTSSVSIDKARSVAENLLLERKPISETSRSYNVIDSRIIDVEGVPVFYIFNFNPIGYAIISADDKVIPIIAYSYEGVFDFDNSEAMPIQFSKLLDSYASQVYFAISNDLIEDSISTPTHIILSIPLFNERSMTSSISFLYWS